MFLLCKVVYGFGMWIALPSNCMNSCSICVAIDSFVC